MVQQVMEEHGLIWLCIAPHLRVPPTGQGTDAFLFLKLQNKEAALDCLPLTFHRRVYETKEQKLWNTSNLKSCTENAEMIGYINKQSYKK